MRSILFVDDEPRILDGIRRMLRKKNKEWSMLFCESGIDALKTMETTPVDVVVSDMRMPGMDGATLLGRVKDLYPKSVRIILSGYSELQASLRAVPVAHQFLVKPCDASELCGTVERACNLNDYMESDPIKAAIGTIDALPVVPSTYHAILAHLGDPSADMSTIVELVQQDPGIVSRILRLVNSSFFGLARRVTSLTEAVNYIGLNTLKNIVLSVEVFREFENGFEDVAKIIAAVQSHSTLAARIASQLLEDPVERDDAFVAALLHDIGILIIATKIPAFYEQIKARSDGHSIVDVENDLAGVTHAEIGAYLLGLWGMPLSIVEAVAHHHRPSAVAPERLDVLGAVHIADALAAELAPMPAPFHRHPMIDGELVESLGLSSRLEEWRKKAIEISGMAKEPVG